MDRNLVNGVDIPIGLGMALAMNPEAMTYFANLPDAQKQVVINGTHQIRSKGEMQLYVANLIK